MKTYAIVYAGRYYGARHQILAGDLTRAGNLVTVLHEGSGDTFTVLACDLEVCAPPVKARQQVLFVTPTENQGDLFAL